MTPSIMTCVMHFGEMGSRWGFNRTVGQIYALLILTEEPLCADDIGATLSFSRSNVSMGLKELQSWRLVNLVHKPGDRKEYFTTPTDMWDIVKTIIEERRKREVDPTLTLLRSTLVEPPQNDSEAYAQQRMTQMLSIIEQATSWADDVQSMDSDTLAKLFKLGVGVGKVLQIGEKLTGKGN